MALVLAAEVAGQEAAEVVQLQIEYDPQPPFQAGSPETAKRSVVRRRCWDSLGLRTDGHWPGVRHSGHLGGFVLLNVNSLNRSVSSS